MIDTQKPTRIDVNGFDCPPTSLFNSAIMTALDSMSDTVYQTISSHPLIAVKEATAYKDQLYVTYQVYGWVPGKPIDSDEDGHVEYEDVEFEVEMGVDYRVNDSIVESEMLLGEALFDCIERETNRVRSQYEAYISDQNL